MLDLFAKNEHQKIENIRSPFNYTGSKYKLLSQLKEYFPKNINVFWDLFCGGGSVFINIASKKIHANDIIPPLIEFYKFLQSTSWDKVIETVKEKNIQKDSQEIYHQLRDRYNEKKDFIDFFILVCSCTNNMMRFNKKFQFNQTWGKRCFNNNTEVKLKEYHDRIYQNNSIEFYNCNFFDCNIQEGNFVYLDPPYLISEAGYNAFWSKESELRLYRLLDDLDSHGIQFMLSNVAKHKDVINPHLDKVKNYNIVELDFDYNKVSRQGKGITKEIVVMNY